MSQYKKSCEFCRHLGTEDDGNYPELAKSWPVCEIFENYVYLKSFPFEKEMECFELNFDYSEFAEQLDWEGVPFPDWSSEHNKENRGSLRVTEFTWKPYPAPHSKPSAAGNALDPADRERQIDQMIERVNGACPKEAIIDWRCLDPLQQQVYDAVTPAELKIAIVEYERAAMPMLREQPTAPES